MRGATRVKLAVAGAVLPVAVWMGCTGDDPALTSGPDASAPADASTADTSQGDRDSAIVDAGTDTLASLCDAAVPGTGGRKLSCGDTTCDLDKQGESPPLQCCIGADASSGTCISPGDAQTCEPPKFNWVCSRSYQCPSPSPCCLGAEELTKTCPATAKAIDVRCIEVDAGCPSGIELCTGDPPETCRNGKTCQILQITNADKRVIGACL
jgi:hypothetical protein